MKDPEALAGASATGSKHSRQSFTSAEYRLQAERATTLCLAIADMPAEDAAPILYAAVDDFHRRGFPYSATSNLMGHALDWADHATEAERKAYAIAAAKRMDPTTREAFRLYLQGGGNG